MFGARGRDRRLAFGDQQTRGLGGLGLRGTAARCTWSQMADKGNESAS
jgi:hypothetical protein